MRCKICDQNTELAFNHLILNHYKVNYFFCESCRFIQTEEPFWLEEAYKNPIATIDTGIVKRNLLFTKRTSVILTVLFNRNGNFLDFGGGSGLFVRMMRDIGFNFSWFDKFSENIFAKGFGQSEDKKVFDLVTSFECFEHFAYPLEEIKNILKHSDNILFSTQLFNDRPPQPEEWWYYNFEAGQHIALYSYSTLKIIAKKFNLNICSDRKGFHLLSKKKINSLIFVALIKLSYLGLGRIVEFISQSKSEQDMLIIKNSFVDKEK